MTSYIGATGPRRPYAVGVIIHEAGGNLLERLSEASRQGYECYVFDNSPDIATFREACQVLPGCHYFTCGRNVGLGVGLAAICSQAFYNGFEGLLFFDQDTVFAGSTLQFVESFLEAHPGVTVSHAAIVFNAKRVGQPVIDTVFAFRNVLLAISSGSLFLLRSAHRVGWHNPSYFVDCVDYEFCLNSSSHGLLIGECSYTPGFNHVVEQADGTTFVFGRERRLRRYSLKRVSNTLSSSMRLLLRSLKAGKPKFAWAISRSIGGYVWWQIVARALPDSAFRDLPIPEAKSE